MPYDLIVVPEQTAIDEETAEELTVFVERAVNCSPMARSSSYRSYNACWASQQYVAARYRTAMYCCIPQTSLPGWTAPGINSRLTAEKSCIRSIYPGIS